MKPCKSHQRDIALLAVQALDESESAAVLKHLDECAACRLYAKQLGGVVSLYLQDAERPIAATPAAAPVFEAHSIPWFKRLFASPVPAMAALAALGICAAVLLTRNRTEGDHLQPLQTTVAIAPQTTPTLPSVGNSRRLAFSDLEDLTRPERVPSSTGSDFVFLVKTRDDGS